jgi:hypothetical protein
VFGNKNSFKSVEFYGFPFANKQKANVIQKEIIDSHTNPKISGIFTFQWPPDKILNFQNNQAASTAPFKQYRLIHAAFEIVQFGIFSNLF